MPAIAELPCLDSSPECLQTLSRIAIAHSLEIAAIHQRLQLSADRITQQQRREWTTWLTTDPLAFVQNLFGGGAVGENRLAVAALELQEADLHRRRMEVAEALAREVVKLVLSYEELERRQALLTEQLETQRQRQALMEVSYRTGQLSTDRMLQMWQRTEDLWGRVEEVAIERGQVVRELEVLCRVTEGTGILPTDF